MAKAGKDLTEARKLVAQALGLTLDGVGELDSIHTLEAWDSISHVRLVLDIERAIGSPLGTDLIVSLETVGDVADALG